VNDARATAARIVAEVVREGHSLSAASSAHLGQIKDPRDRGFAQELAYGALRFLPQLEPLVQALLERPLKSKDTDVFALIAIGLYQIIHLETAPHAAVSATAAAGRGLKKSWATPLVNAVLRNFLRNRERILAEVHAQEPARYAHPGWLLAELKEAWPAQWQSIAEANNRRPPMALRVNARHLSRDDYLKVLNQSASLPLPPGEGGGEGVNSISDPLTLTLSRRERGYTARAAPYAPQGILLSQPVDVDKLPGFREGWVSVQDAAAQLAAPLLDLQPGLRVLDACAAPGGKAAHILETCPEGVDLVAVEKDLDRLGLLTATLERLRLDAQVIHADASRPETWWDGQRFDRILLDAPCSGSGVIRRHPDIKTLRRAEDIPRLAQEQAQLLDALWPLLAPRGKLLYVTCSILPTENQRQIESFLDRHPEARACPVAASWGLNTGSGRQILPSEGGMDGFFYALLSRDLHGP
jgi:16S rRNA (cytosine967-C5)-methyltransferase